MIATLDASLAGYDESRSRAVFNRVLERVRALPGVASASLALTTPYGERNFDRNASRDGRATDERVARRVAPVEDMDSALDDRPAASASVSGAATQTQTRASPLSSMAAEPVWRAAAS